MTQALDRFGRSITITLLGWGIGIGVPLFALFKSEPTRSFVKEYWGPLLVVLVVLLPLLGYLEYRRWTSAPSEDRTPRQAPAASADPAHHCRELIAQFRADFSAADGGTIRWVRNFMPNKFLSADRMRFEDTVLSWRDDPDKQFADAGTQAALNEFLEAARSLLDSLWDHSFSYRAHDNDGQLRDIDGYSGVPWEWKNQGFKQSRRFHDAVEEINLASVRVVEEHRKFLTLAVGNGL